MNRACLYLPSLLMLVVVSLGCFREKSPPRNSPEGVVNALFEKCRINSRHGLEDLFALETYTHEVVSPFEKEKAKLNALRVFEDALMSPKMREMVNRKDVLVEEFERDAGSARVMVSMDRMPVLIFKVVMEDGRWRILDYRSVKSSKGYPMEYIKKKLN